MRLEEACAEQNEFIELLKAVIVEERKRSDKLSNSRPKMPKKSPAKTPAFVPESQSPAFVPANQSPDHSITAGLQVL